MKCLCGYEHSEEWDKTRREYRTVSGDKPFEQIRGTFLRYHSRDYGPDEKEEIDLWACPECHTIKVKARWE